MKKIITTATGVLLVLFMAAYSFINSFNVGTFIPMFIGIIIGIWCFLPEKNIIKWLKKAFIFIVIIYMALMVFVALMAQSNTADFDEDAVIVLGCGLKGSIPSGNLIDRLDTAIKYYGQNPKALIVVSGGQGPNEDCTEAGAMHKYLTDKGIPENSVIMEDKSTSTTENYIYSKAILDKILGSDYETVYITNSFHSYRAGRLAKLNGLNARAYNAHTKIQSLLPNYSREVLAVIQLWLFNK